MNKVRAVLFISVITGLLTVMTVMAQSESITLSMSRDFGYGGFNGDIQGLFSMKVTGPADLMKVDFYIDQAMIGEVTEAPFRLQFNTDNYPLGRHVMYAVGFTSGSQQLRSNEISANFVPASSSTKVLIPVLIIVLGAVLLSLVIPVLATSRRKLEDLPLGAERSYGLRGGSICPRCHRPFALHPLGLHLLTFKLDRCPYCGKWSILPPLPLAKLREAEKAELEQVAAGPQIAAETEDEKLKKELDDSKFQGM